MDLCSVQVRLKRPCDSSVLLPVSVLTRAKQICLSHCIWVEPHFMSNTSNCCLATAYQLWAHGPEMVCDGPVVCLGCLTDCGLLVSFTVLHGTGSELHVLSYSYRIFSPCRHSNTVGTWYSMEPFCCSISDSGYTDSFTFLRFKTNNPISLSTLRSECLFLNI